MSSPRTILITGCSDGGIGHEMALQCHAHGLRVFATSRTLASMETLKEKGIETLELDVTVSSSIQSVKEHVEGLTGGSLDILVNNAGVCYESTASDDTMTRIKSLYAVNVFGAMEMTQAFIPLLMKSHQHPRIVQVGSCAALCPTPFYTAYNSSKAALLQYGNTLRIELEPFGIKVITLNAGKVKSRIIKSSSNDALPEGSIYTPIKDAYEGIGHDIFTIDATSCEEYTAKVVAHILKKDASPFHWAGSHSRLVWFFDSFFPRTIYDMPLRKTLFLDKLSVMYKQKRTAVHSV